MHPLSGTEVALARLHDVALLDLDGVVYLGDRPVPGAPGHLARAADAGIRLGFVTNNASRSPEDVATLLAGMGVPARPDQVVTSAQVAAAVLATRLEPAARVLVVGAAALADQVRLHGLTPVATADVGDGPIIGVAAVVQGFDPDIGWRDLAAATRAVRAGAWWVACNTDRTVPSAGGPLPGNGALVEAVRIATRAEPMVTGKPEPAMHAECVRRLRAGRPLVVGDRLDTDIEGASRVGCASLLVLTGVTTPSDLLRAAPQHRPTYLAADLAGLLDEHPPVSGEGAARHCRSWTATADGPQVVLSGGGDHMDALRALAAAAWSSGITGVRADGQAAERALHALGLAA
ncbi:MAG: HAD-IIA family hydrolase [Geodermatophilaceae bacterium]|nr:HAD-IIA family hydrolase [Geodermatophilaceae bacterium]